MSETHAIEIAVHEHDEDLQQWQLTTAMEHHPLAEISKSPGHLLLLKLWQRQDDLFARRVAIRETRMSSVKREISHLCSSFLLFHGLFLTLIFAASVGAARRRNSDWWIPSAVSLATSTVIVVMVQEKLRVYWKVHRQLQNERGSNRQLARFMQELRMKGASFDLDKQPVCGTKKMKSSSVEIKWGPVGWFKRYSASILLACFSGLMFPASKLIL